METRNCGKLRYPRLDALEISHQRHQLKGEGFAVDGAGRLASPLLGVFKETPRWIPRRGYVEGRQGSPRVALSDANCLCSNCLRVTSLEQSSNCLGGRDVSNRDTSGEKMLDKCLELTAGKLDNGKLRPLEFTATKHIKLSSGIIELSREEIEGGGDGRDALC